MLNLDSFLQSLMCVIFSMIGHVIRGLLYPKSKNREKSSQTVTVIVVGLVIFFAEPLLPDGWQNEKGIAIISTFAGAVGVPMLRFILTRPAEALRLWKDLNKKEK